MRLRLLILVVALALTDLAAQAYDKVEGTVMIARALVYDNPASYGSRKIVATLKRGDRMTIVGEASGDWMIELSSTADDDGQIQETDGFVSKKAIDAGDTQ